MLLSWKLRMKNWILQVDYIHPCILDTGIRGKQRQVSKRFPPAEGAFLAVNEHFYDTLAYEIRENNYFRRCLHLV